ncbi:alpha/beta hydrolase [Streptomyces sp. NPDC059063]|uniref:alpha/beta hydrolase n=1 Tax=unclassified Streptomyces TaxID=2593676 RepID=UPI0036C3EA92
MDRPARHRRIVPLLAIGVTATLVPGLTAGPASAAPAPAADTTARQLAPYTQQHLTWKRCDPDRPARFQCATLKVPLDYGKPGGKRIKVAVSRVKTSVPGKRRGILTSNPGGPGGPGLDLPLDFARGLPKKVREQYDMVGFDPRGVGRSTPVGCGLRGNDLTYPRPNRSATEFASNVKWAKRFAAKCQDKAGDLLPYITTRNTARDMDVLRAVLGEKKLSYFGVSYGTALGAVYTQLFPRRVDRFILDSAVDPGLMWRGMYRVWASEAGPAFKRWAKWTGERDAKYHLGNSEAKVTRTFWNLVKRADREPIVFGRQKLDGALVRDAMRENFFTVRGGAELMVELKKAADAGRGASAAPRAQTPGDNEMASHFSVVCGDSDDWPRDPETYRRDLAADKARYPLYGDFTAGISPCAYWPKGAEPVTRVDNDVPLLLLQNEWDPQTPLVTGQAMHRALKGSRMVTVDEGEGHGVLFAENTTACAKNISMAYLATGELPARDVTCHATPGAGQRSESTPRAF